MAYLRITIRGIQVGVNKIVRPESCLQTLPETPPFRRGTERSIDAAIRAVGKEASPQGVTRFLAR